MHRLLYRSLEVVSKRSFPHSISFLHPFSASSLISFVSTGPLVVPSLIASTTAMRHLIRLQRLHPRRPQKPSQIPSRKTELNTDPIPVAAANGIVIFLEASHNIPGRIKNDLIFGNSLAITLSASLFVVIYRLGKTGAPPAALIYAKHFTPSLFASCASVIALSLLISSYVTWPSFSWLCRSSPDFRL